MFLEAVAEMAPPHISEDLGQGSCPEPLEVETAWRRSTFLPSDQSFRFSIATLG